MCFFKLKWEYVEIENDVKAAVLMFENNTPVLKPAYPLPAAVSLGCTFQYLKHTTASF